MDEKKQNGGVSGTQYSVTHDVLMQSNDMMSQKSTLRKKP